LLSLKMQELGIEKWKKTNQTTLYYG
jgi:hypothetical protein